MAVETTSDLVSQLRDEIGFDVSGGDSTLLGWLNSRHRRMVVDSRCYRRRTVISGGTVAGQADYVLPPDVLEVGAVEVDGAPYDRARRQDVELAKVSLAVFVGPSGVVAQGANGASAEVLSFYPAPDTGGLEISLLGPVRPPELSTSPVVNPVVPAEFFEGLVHGAAAVGLRRTDSRHDEANQYEQHYLSEIERLRKLVRRRWGGVARIQIRWP